jgi:hypothetical protein
MAGKSRVTADEDGRRALKALAHSRDRGEADRARFVADAVWLTSRSIAEAFGVREDTVRLWRSWFAKGDAEALKATIAPSPAPVRPRQRCGS